MKTVDQVLVRGLPEALRTFMSENCRIPASAFRSQPGSSLPDPAQRLLVHAQDMTSTLAAFHESQLRVEILQRQIHSELYLREVFLRTLAANTIVEYGVIAIALEQFTAPQREAIQSGQTPLGALLHRFEIPFESAPIGFFSITSEALAATPFKVPKNATCFGRFNRLTKPTSEPLAWILEILPPPE